MRKSPWHLLLQAHEQDTGCISSTACETGLCPFLDSPDALLFLVLLWGSIEVNFSASSPGSLILSLCKEELHLHFVK